MEATLRSWRHEKFRIIMLLVNQAQMCGEFCLNFSSWNFKISVGGCFFFLNFDEFFFFWIHSRGNLPWVNWRCLAIFFMNYVMMKMSWLNFIIWFIHFSENVWIVWGIVGFKRLDIIVKRKILKSGLNERIWQFDVIYCLIQGFFLRSKIICQYLALIWLSL